MEKSPQEAASNTQNISQQTNQSSSSSQSQSSEMELLPHPLMANDDQNQLELTNVSEDTNSSCLITELRLLFLTVATIVSLL